MIILAIVATWTDVIICALVWIVTRAVPFTFLYTFEYSVYYLVVWIEYESWFT